MKHVALYPSFRLDILSLCTGGYGLDFGVELAIPGARTVCVVERKAFAVARLVSAMQEGLIPPAPVWSDARTLDGRRWRGCLDGVIGGIPCQPHSLAGKRRGAGDERDLWSDARRIFVQSGAWFILIENVEGMLSAGPGQIPGAKRVWRDLRRLGCDVEGGLFSAAEVGASHERKRVFILGVADHAGGGRCAERASGDGGRSARAAGSRRCELADADNPGSQGRRNGLCEVGRQGPERHAGLGGGELVDTASVGRREGRAKPEIRRGRDTAPGAGGAVDDASIARGRPVPIQQGRQDETGRDPDRPSPSMGDPNFVGERQPDNEDGAQPWKDTRLGACGAGLGLFPPGPGDIDGWRTVLERSPQLEPAVRRMADGMASRVDALRMLGNGVVSLEGAYALRVLATRLARRGSAGAARLVRMMEGI